MSIQALDYAFNLHVGRPPAKLVLLCLANYADSNGFSYPCQRTIERVTSLNRKTIISALKHLEEMGHISDSGRRVGATGQVVVYSINGLPDSAQRCKNETIPKTGLLKTGGNSPKNDHQTVPFFPFNSPKNGTRNLIGTLKEPIKKKIITKKEIILPSYISQEAFDAFGSYRKELKKPLTSIAKKRLIEKLAAMHAKGHDVNALLMDAIDRGWLTVYEPKPKHQPQQGKPVPWYERETTGNNVEK